MSSTLSGEDTLLCVFNPQNSFTQVVNLQPGIFNKYYFRILSTRICLLEVSFGKTPYILNDDGTIGFATSFIGGDKTIYYSCTDQNINTATVRLLDPLNNNEQLSCIFEFKQDAPSEYFLE